MSSNRARLRAELFKFAVNGKFPTYSDVLPFLTPRIQQGWRTEWSEDLNQIAMEETRTATPMSRPILSTLGLSTREKWGDVLPPPRLSRYPFSRPPAFVTVAANACD
jgi:hypothetical protein